MKNLNREKCALVLKLIPLELGTIAFAQTLTLLQVDPAFGDEPKTVSESCYKTEDTSIFTWSSIPGVGHYRWLRDPIHQLPPNNKVDYLVRTIRRILNFLQLWTIIVT